MKTVKEIFEVYESNEQVRSEFDKEYGTGAADFFSDAVKAFYKE